MNSHAGPNQAAGLHSGNYPLYRENVWLPTSARVGGRLPAEMAAGVCQQACAILKRISLCFVLERESGVFDRGIAL